MCEFNGNIVFCSCSEKIDKSKSYWELFKIRKGKMPQVFSIGEFNAPYIVDMKYEEILSQLNRPNGCFDFNYSPESGDFLEVALPDRKYTFDYSGAMNCWVVNDKFLDIFLMETFKEGLFKTKISDGFA